MTPFLLQLRWSGRFGNRMCTYAYGATYARRTGRAYWLPSEWEGTRLFQRQDYPVVKNDDLRRALTFDDEGEAANQQRLRSVREHYPDAQLYDAELAEDPYLTPDYPICHANSCAYNARIFSGMSTRYLKEVFELSDEVKQLEAYKRFADLQGLYDVAHLRRDDIADAAYNRTHPQGYSVISKASYTRAFAKFGFAEDAIEWVSDDYIGKWHVGRKQRYRGAWEYPVGSEYLPGIMFDWLHDFLKLYFARTIFRANSSFSWWAAMLSPTARVFSPVLDKSHIFGVDGLEEIDVDFVEGNHPHWAYGGRYAKPDIVLGE